ncbi:MAG: sensor histidine kinase [Gemmatimonadota bacterium]
MAIATATTAPEPDRASGRAGQFRRELLRFFNPGTVAAMFFICVVVAFTRWLPSLYFEPLSNWALDGIRYLRQTLISGVCALAAIALGLALARAFDWTRPRTYIVGAATVVAAATAGAVARLIVFGLSFSEIPERWTWGLGIVGLWSLVGGLGFALALFAREEIGARRRLSDAACARETLEAQMVQARLSALQAQIEPHFLFNTLANVKRLYETAPARGREMLESLIEYLRAALPSMRQRGSTLKRELELARAYLTILQMRMGERLHFTIDADPALLGAEVPPLVLGTLIENAIKHGLSPLPEGGSIAIRAHRSGEDVRIEVRDTGRGFSGHGGSGVGLANIRSRLAALYGARAVLELSANTPRGVAATVALPWRAGAESPA